MDKMLNYAIAAVLAVIGIMVGLSIIIPVIVALFPSIITNIVSLSTLGNFTLASLFAVTGFMPILLSLFVFLLVLALPIAGIVLAISYFRSKR